MRANLHHLFVLVPGLTAACSSDPSPQPDLIGTAEFAITVVPEDVECVAISADGPETVRRSFDVSPGESALLRMGRLAFGETYFAANAFAGNCALVDDVAIPTWSSDQVTAFVAAGATTRVRLVLHHGGNVDIEIDFADGGVSPPGAPVDAQPSADASGTEPDTSNTSSDTSNTDPDASDTEPLAEEVVVSRIGDGVGLLTNTGNPVFIDRYTNAGTLVQTTALPTAASGANQPLLLSGTAASEGGLSRSVDRHFVTLLGYGATAGGTVSLATTAATAVPRVVARLGASTLDTSTALTDVSSANNPRTAVTTNGLEFWVGGGAGGPHYATLSSTTSTQLSTDVTNIRRLGLFDDRLFGTTTQGSVRVAQIGAGVPAAPGQTWTNLPGLPTTAISPYDFVFVDLDPATPGVDVLYLTDDTAGTIAKYSLVSGTWVPMGSVAVDQVRGLTATSPSPSVVTLFAVSPTTLVKLVDASGYNGVLSGAPAVLATALSNQAFRGVALAPLP